jgi:hypothetical protein
MFAFQNNRRNQPRAPVHLPAVASWDERDIDTYVLLISEGGCFVELSPAPPKDTRFKVSFDIPGKGPHTAEVQVRYAAELGDYRGRHDARGVGCQFVQVSATTKQAIRELINQVKKSYAQIQFAMAVAKPDTQLAALLEKAQLPALKSPRELRDAIQWGLKQMGS